MPILVSAQYYKVPAKKYHNYYDELVVGGPWYIWYPSVYNQFLWG